MAKNIVKDEIDKTEAAVAASVETVKQAAEQAAPEVAGEPEATTPVDAMEEEIEYIFPYTNEKDTTLYIGVNGRFFTIRRGESVKVPRYVVQTYLDSERQRTSLYRLQDEFTSNKTLDSGVL